MGYNDESKRKPIPAKLRHWVFERDGYRCVECGATNKETTLEIDHIIPVSKGGTNDIDNLQTLCKTCNRKKRDRIWDPIKSREIQIGQYRNRIFELEEKLKHANEDEKIDIKYRIVRLEEAIFKLEQDIQRYKIKEEKEKLYKKLYILDDAVLSKIFAEFNIYDGTKKQKIKIILKNYPLTQIENSIKKCTDQVKSEQYLYDLDSIVFNILIRDVSSTTDYQKIKIFIERHSFEEIKNEVQKIENRISTLNQLSEKHFVILCINLKVSGSSKGEQIENLLKYHEFYRIQQEISNIKRNDKLAEYLMTLPIKTIDELSLIFKVPSVHITKEDKCYYIANTRSKIEIDHGLIKINQNNEKNEYLMTFPDEIIDELSLRFNVPRRHYTKEDKCYYISRRYLKIEIENELHKINQENEYKDFLKSQSDETMNKIRLRLQIPDIFASKDSITDYLFKNYSFDEIKYEINFNKEEKLRLIKKYSELDNTIIYKFDIFFPELSQYDKKEDKINYLVESYSYIIIDDKIEKIKFNIQRETDEFKRIFDKLMKKTQEKTFEHFSIVGLNRKELLFKNFSLNEITSYIKNFEKEFYYPIFYNEIDENVLYVIFNELNVPLKLNSKKEKLDYLFNKFYVNKLCHVIDAINKNIYPTYCPICLQKMRKDDNFCPFCAYEVKLPYNEKEKKLFSNYCPICLNRIMSYDKFCSYCGYNLDPSIKDKFIKSLKDSFKF